jgi:hypothetical protein
LLNAKETAVLDTPAAPATSAMVTRDITGPRGMPKFQALPHL